ncbi:hypothetical protein [Nonomuraea africana]|uniref:hypothetical protein n=1 Tax=Nonomuraea africana TaxID=46171 RepID=UPI0033D2BA4A
MPYTLIATFLAATGFSGIPLWVQLRTQLGGGIGRAGAAQGGGAGESYSEG